MTQIQTVIDGCSGECHIPSDIYHSPLKIEHPCRIIGDSSVILCGEEQSASVVSGGVELRDLRIESLSSERTAPVLICPGDTFLDNVTVRGNIEKNGKLSDSSGIPLSFDLGQFAADCENSFVFDINVTEDSTAESCISNVEVIPHELKEGENRIKIKIDALKNGIYLFGVLKIKSDVIREIYIQGNAADKASVCTEQPLTYVRQPQVGLSVKNLPAETVPPEYPENAVTVLQKGQRVPIGRLDAVEDIKLLFSCDHINRPLDIDGYAFILDRSNRVTKDDDLIFWGNKASDHGAVRLLTTNGLPCFDIDTSVGNNGKIAVCYSIYGDDPDETFKYIRDPYVRIFIDNTERFRFYLNGLSLEKTINAVEVYEHGGVWKLHCVGAGYRAGLKRMCEDYGVDISD